MENKLRVIVEVLIILVLAVYFLFKTAIPELRESIGSSGHLLNYKEYHSMFEVNIDEKCDVAFIVNSNGVIFHLLFFDKNSVSLYNQDIENHNIEDALDLSIPILLSNQLISNDSSISITSYGKSSERFIEAFQFSLLKNNLSSNITQIEGNLIERGTRVDSTVRDEKTSLEAMDYYSKDISFQYSNKKSNTSTFKPSSLARSVYRKIEDYASSQNIVNLELDQVIIPIQSIPADRSSEYYPSINSWYYLVDGKVYAYIEFIQNVDVYGFCFQGSIDDIREGKCES